MNVASRFLIPLSPLNSFHNVKFAARVPVNSRKDRKASRVRKDAVAKKRGRDTPTGLFATTLDSPLPATAKGQGSYLCDYDLRVIR